MDPNNHQSADGEAGSKQQSSTVQAITSAAQQPPKSEQRPQRGKSKSKNSNNLSNVISAEKKSKASTSNQSRQLAVSDVAANHNSQATLPATQSNNTAGSIVADNNKSAAHNSSSSAANTQVLSSQKPPANKRGAESFTSQSKREQSASRPATNRKHSKMSRDVTVEGSGVSRSNSNSIKPQNADGVLIDSANVSIQQPSSMVKQSTSLNKLPKKGKDAADAGEVTSQSNTLDVQGSAVKANESTGGGKTPLSKASKRAKNVEKRNVKNPAGEKSQGGAKDSKQGASSNKIFELQPTLQRSNTAQGNDLVVQGGSAAQPLQPQNENVKSQHKSEVNSKEAEGQQTVADGRRESINNGSELLLNHNSTAERQLSQSQLRHDSVFADNNVNNAGKDTINQENAMVHGSAQRKMEEEKKNEQQFNFRGRSSSQSEASNQVVSAVDAAGLNKSKKVFEYNSKTEKRGNENSALNKDNKSLSDAQDDGQENFGDDEQAPSDQEVDDTNLNIMEKFRQVMKDRFKDGILENRPLGPPPEELIRKSAFEQEPVKTGAPIAFVKFQRLIGQERIEKMNPDNEKKGEVPAETSSNEISQATTICEYILNARDANVLVYCRFGERYLADMERRQKSMITALNQPTSNLSTATYLINIKKLVEEHNIDGEKKDFKTMKTGQMGKSMQLPPNQYYRLQGPEDKTLIFESRFESGNLLAAIKVSDTEYDLILQNDINTNGHTQWYFFRVGNTTKGLKVKFNVLNLMKPDSLYNYGMKILSFSTKVKETAGMGWHRVGENINYYMNSYKRDNFRFSRNHYTFTFTHTFEHDDDIQYFSHCFPYTYSDLCEDLNRIEKDPATQNYFHRATLTRTLAGNKCEYITITSKDKDPKSAKAMAKKGVFISSRVHPGESNASWMMRGVIEYLVAQTPEAKALRDNFVFKIVPILNPDGVINGNYRCSLSGQDLNRRWKAPSRVIHPVIFAVKKLIRQFAKERNLVLYCDLHGHSRRKNIFMYGNNLKDKPHESRVFPYIMSKLCDFFSFEQSRFSMNRLKDGTARIAMFKELNIPNIFTMEASFCGADRGEYKDCHFSTDYLMEAGAKLMEALIVYCKIEVNHSIKEVKNKKEEQEIQLPNSEKKKVTYKDLNAQALEKELHGNKKLIAMTMGDDGNSSGSDSEPSADNLDDEEIEKIVPQKKKEEPKKKPLPPPAKKDVKPIKKPQSPPAQIKRPPVMKEISKSPVKRPMYNAFDRLSLRKKKPEMKDAWTQTTPKSKEQMEKERREHRQRKNAHYLMLQQQQQQLLMQKFQQQQQHMHMSSYNQRSSYPVMQETTSQQLMDPRLSQNPSNFKTKQGYMYGQQSNFKGQSKSIHHQQQPPNILMHNQMQPNISMKDKERKPNFQEMGHSPQPQIRIRTDHHPSGNNQYKMKNNTDQSYPQSQIQNYNNLGGPQNGSATQQLQHRGSNKHLPQIQSSSSQRNKKPSQNSYIEQTPSKNNESIAMRQAVAANQEKQEYARSLTKTLNQTQYNSLKNKNNANLKTDQLMAQTQIHQRHTSGQSGTTQNQQNLMSQQVSRSAYNGTGRKLVSSQNHNNSTYQQQHQYNAETPDTTKKRQIMNPNTSNRQQIHVSMSPTKLNKVPLNSQSTCEPHMSQQVMSHMSNPAKQPLLNNFQNPALGQPQQTPSLYSGPTFSRMQTQKADMNHNSIAALMYNGKMAAPSGITSNQTGHNSSAMINPQSHHQNPSGSDSKMSQKKPSSSTTQKVLWTNSTIQQQQQQQSMQLFAHKAQNQTVTLNYRGQASSQNQNLKNDQRLLIGGAKHDSKNNVFSGITLTQSGNKILGGPVNSLTADGQMGDGLAQASKQLSQTGTLNKSMAQHQMSHLAYK